MLAFLKVLSFLFSFHFIQSGHHIPDDSQFSISDPELSPEIQLIESTVPFERPVVLWNPVYPTPFAHKNSSCCIFYLSERCCHLPMCPSQKSEGLSFPLPSPESVTNSCLFCFLPVSQLHPCFSVSITTSLGSPVDAGHPISLLNLTERDKSFNSTVISYHSSADTLESKNTSGQNKKYRQDVLNSLAMSCG